jgi:hypothetical protein
MEKMNEGAAINQHEARQVPSCPMCQSANTAAVVTGIIGRRGTRAAATSRLRLVRNPFGDERFYCNDCEMYFD